MNCEVTAPATPAEERRIQILRMSGEFLDTLTPETAALGARWGENGLPDDAMVCGLFYQFEYNAFALVIASASYDTVPVNSCLVAMPPPLLSRHDDAEPLPFFRQLVGFIERAKRSIGPTANLQDVVILPRFYQEGQHP